MSVVPIITVPNPTLREKSEEIKKVDKKVKEIAQNLLDTLDAAEEPEGAGLAAPQIGISKRMLVARRFIPNKDNPEEISIKNYVLINPFITKKSQETDLSYEGCLSVPDTYGKVERPKKIKVEALDENGKPVRIQTSGFFARVIQHEMDHLDGIVFTDKVVGETVSGKELDNMKAAA